MSRNQDNEIHYSKCHLCEGVKHPISTALHNDECQYVSQDAILILTKLVNSKVFQASRKPRVLGMVSVKRFSVHFNDHEFVDLGVSPLGQWCLASLHSSTRELRVLGG